MLMINKLSNIVPVNVPVNILLPPIPQQHLFQALQEAVEGLIVAAVVHTHEQHAHVVQDVHYLA